MDSHFIDIEIICIKISHHCLRFIFFIYPNLFKFKEMQNLNILIISIYNIMENQRTQKNSGGWLKSIARISY